MTCSFTSCGRDILAKDLCPGHYAQQRRGRPLTPLNGKRGFAALPSDRRRELAVQGGKAAHEHGTAHRWTQTEARRAGVLGAAQRHSWPAARTASELQRRGLTT